MELARHAMHLTLVLMVILLVPSLIVGLLVSIFQAATQINEMTLSFIPKLMVTMAVLVIGGPLMLRMLIEYIQQLMNNIPGLVAG
jgi:flagellar biosynthetic protein FliQ